MIGSIGTLRLMQIIKRQGDWQEALLAQDHFILISSPVVYNGTTIVYCSLDFHTIMRSALRMLMNYTPAIITSPLLPKRMVMTSLIQRLQIALKLKQRLVTKDLLSSLIFIIITSPTTSI